MYDAWVVHAEDHSSSPNERSQEGETGDKPYTKGTTRTKVVTTQKTPKISQQTWPQQIWALLRPPSLSGAVWSTHYIHTLHPCCHPLLCQWPPIKGIPTTNPISRRQNTLLKGDMATCNELRILWSTPRHTTQAHWSYTPTTDIITRYRDISLLNLLTISFTLWKQLYWDCKMTTRGQWTA